MPEALPEPRLPAPAAYPVERLLPRRTYCLLTALPVPYLGGWLVRRTRSPTPFDAADKLGADQFCSPREKLTTEGLSLSLLGQFEVPDAGWRATAPAPAPLDGYWRPPPAGQAPTPALMPDPADVAYMPAATWGTYALAVGALDGYVLPTGRGAFQCHVCHLPTHRNYWHFELRFRADAGRGEWLHEAPALPAKQQKNLGGAIRDALLEKGFARPTPATCPPWPAALYDSAPAPTGA